VRIALRKPTMRKQATQSSGRHPGCGRCLTFLVLATVLGQLALVLWFTREWGWAWIRAVLAVGEPVIS